uniref:Cobalamin binding intrinsic factor n=1 Tax=Naja naja TaxID=35670 RepID=A0A8C6X1B2_NAJNA
VNWSKIYLTNVLAVLDKPLTVLDLAVPNDQQGLVRGILTQLENWASLQGKPDPSILIALNLAKDHNLSVIILCPLSSLLAEMTSGKVALYVLALRSSCQNPADVITPEKHVNLVQVLEEKTKEEIKHIRKETNGLALFCVYEGRISPQQSKFTGTLQAALALATKDILNEQQSNGLLGNVYSTGLAMQALSVTSEFYTADAWNCPKTLNEVLSKITEGAFSIPAAASQILPSLVGKTYLDVRGLTCSSETVISPAFSSLSFVLTVHYKVINQLIGPYFEYSTTVKVPKGSVLLAVLEAAKQFNANEFSFQTEETSWGPMVTSINGLQGSTNEKTYWQFLSGKTPLEQVNIQL